MWELCSEGQESGWIKSEYSLIGGVVSRCGCLFMIVSDRIEPSRDIASFAISSSLVPGSHERIEMKNGARKDV